MDNLRSLDQHADKKTQEDHIKTAAGSFYSAGINTVRTSGK
jgi:hypothetical protein